ncbi:MAG: pantoate kinase [Candidatus Hodarchaeales archaeon]
MREVAYWVASHLTGIFEIRDSAKDILHKGSRGAGVCIDRGVTTRITEIDSPQLEIYFNQKKIPPSEAIVTKSVVDLEISSEMSRGVRVNHEFEIPIKGGFGASAAGALGTAYCLNDFFKLKKPDLILFQIAHQAEVQTRSGLGDIIGLFQGGLEIRVQEGAPGIGKTIAIDKMNDWKIATAYFGSLSTASILSNPVKREAVNRAGSKLLEKLIRTPEFEVFVQVSHEFTKKVKLYSKQLEKKLNELPKSIIGAQVMLGDTMILFYQDEDDLQELDSLKTHIQKENICEKSVVRL